MVNFHCRYCQEQTGPVPFPKTDMEQVWLRAFMELHESCGVSAVEPVRSSAVVTTVKRQEEQTPAPLRTPTGHEHQWLAITETFVPGVVVRDCACGARQRVRGDGYGLVQVLNHYEADEATSSLASAVFTIEAGKPLRDRWSH